MRAWVGPLIIKTKGGGLWHNAFVHMRGCAAVMYGLVFPGEL